MSSSKLSKSTSENRRRRRRRIESVYADFHYSIQDEHLLIPRACYIVALRLAVMANDSNNWRRAWIRAVEIVESFRPNSVPPHLRGDHGWRAYNPLLDNWDADVTPDVIKDFEKRPYHQISTELLDVCTKQFIAEYRALHNTGFTFTGLDPNALRRDECLALAGAACKLPVNQSSPKGD